MPTPKYEEKRDFTRTPEPRGGRKSGESTNQYVVHRHEARRLHYDLRLHIGPELCSWAVPKGFSYNPRVKHLAVRTEDHPLEYLTFEGMIPKGEYGAGTIEIWDTGTFRVLKGTPDDAMVDGDLKLWFDGKRLRGEWHLFRTDEQNWLLVKGRDVYQRDTDHLLPVSSQPDRMRAERFPKIPPMRAASTVSPFSSPQWLFELDFTGRRIMARFNNGKAVVGSGKQLGVIANELKRLRCSSALVDGVLVGVDENGLPSLQALETPESIVFYAFDLLHWDGFSTRDLPLIWRKELLQSLLPESDRLLFVDAVTARGEELAQHVAAQGLGGVIAKLATGPYVSGESEHWRRVAAQTKKTKILPAHPRVRISNPDKVFWTDSGYTKRDLCNYYEAVADYLIPHVDGRPIHMQRFPNGIDGKSFYQRRAPERLPDWVTVADMEKERHVVCSSRRTLLYLANLGTIDLHPWLSQVETPELPDWTVIDIDAKESSFADAVRVARKVGTLLRGLGLRPYLKTSGGTGLHVFVPLSPQYSYDQSRMFAEGVARVVAMENSELATVERNPAHRKQRIYVDFLQNRRGQTIVPPYSARPVPGARVSAPLDWDELHVDLSADEFTIKSMPGRLSQLGDIFAPVLTDRQDLSEAIDKLSAYVS